MKYASKQNKDGISYNWIETEGELQKAIGWGGTHRSIFNGKGENK